MMIVLRKMRPVSIVASGEGANEKEEIEDSGRNWEIEQDSTDKLAQERESALEMAYRDQHLETESRKDREIHIWDLAFTRKEKSRQNRPRPHSKFKVFLLYYGSKMYSQILEKFQKLGEILVKS